jgi:hypothetical protein
LKEDAEDKKGDIVDRITALNYSINQLDEDIKNTTTKIGIINKNVINTVKEIDINKKTITILRKKISENTEILLEYLIYIYKK